MFLAVMVGWLVGTASASPLSWQALCRPCWAKFCLSSGCPRSALLQVILGVSGTVMSVLSIGALEKFEVSSQADHITIVSLSPSLLMLAYRVS